MLCRYSGGPHLVCSASVVSELHLDITLLSDEYCMLNMLLSDIQQ